MFGSAVCMSSSRGNFLHSLPPALTQAASTQDCPHEGTLKCVRRYHSWAGGESSSGTQRALVFSPPVSFPCELFIPLWTASLLDPISFWINFHPYNCPPWLMFWHTRSVSSWGELHVLPLSLSAVAWGQDDPSLWMARNAALVTYFIQIGKTSVSSHFLSFTLDYVPDGIGVDRALWEPRAGEGTWQCI